MPKVRKKKTRISNMPTALVGRAGMSLVEFQLGRRGFESVQTPPNSKSGDLWAEIESGRISIEVKTTEKGRSWYVKNNQTTSEFFCLVNLDDAMCYVVTRAEMTDVLNNSGQAHPGVYIVRERTLPADAREGWSRIGSRRMSLVFAERRRPNYKATRRVTRQMADGSMKTYVYPPTNQNESPRNVIP